ncbi:MULTISPECIES: zf-HC2 domain-containing protein [unclassified Beijerinckia]|uniref:anti-sigma factor family protein n=1 Tax=unclassified Beijerinckia TaxID=2638183 RepID=UPI0008984C40|nr:MULTISPECIES: zf-HC2 domain-containing protein [unclassified Beijerinckia]MDH7796525.1 anti-sigma factor RsiW [Beijerinckia sp. GAS462]SEC48817.1 Putative zinc-finger [Beijerinckia sp. 28-YEA-48]
MFSSKLVSAAELSAFLDGETEPSRRALLREHLRSSPSDAQRLARWRQREEALRTAFAPAIREGAGPIAPLARSLDQKVFPRDRRPALRVSGAESQRSDEPIRNLAATLPDVAPSPQQRLILVAVLAFLAGAAAMYGGMRLLDEQRAPTQQTTASERPGDSTR